MQDDRKKTMVVVGLFVIMIAVGAFQMIPKGQPAPPPKKSLVASAFDPKTPSAKVVAPAPGNTAPVGMNAAADATAAPTPASSPLGTVAIPTPALDANAADALPAEPPLAERDPFEAPPDANPAPAVKTSRGGIAVASGGRASVADNGPSSPIKQISGSLEPATLPNAQGPGGIKGLIAGGPGGVKVAPDAPVFSWRLVGLMSGSHPLAVLADPTGNQRLIRTGSAIDPESKLISVDRDSATVVFRGKTLRLSLVGDQNAK